MQRCRFGTKAAGSVSRAVGGARAGWMQIQNLKRECRTQTGSANCFYSCILASGCLLQGSLFSRPLNCIPKSSDGHEPQEPAMHTLGVKGRGSLEQVASRSWSLRDALGLGRQRNDFQLPVRCCGRHHKSLPCFLWHQEFNYPAAQLLGRLRHLCSLQDETPTFLQRLRLSDVSKEDISYVHTEKTSLISKQACVLHSCYLTFRLSYSWWNEQSSLTC